MSKTKQDEYSRHETTPVDALAILRSAVFYLLQAGLVVTAWNDGGNLVLRVRGVNYQADPANGASFITTKAGEVVPTISSESVEGANP